MDNLFKLKKDGKAVGYLKIEDSIIWAKENLLDGWDVYDPVFELKFDQALPYVCDDKNRDKVFAGDSIKMRNPSTDEWMEGEILRPTQKLDFCINAGQMNWSLDNEIELIKDSNEC